MSWETIIGLEVHVELATDTKIFCSCSTKFGGAPNTQCCPICLGLPGALPFFQQKVLDNAILAGLAFGCEITTHTKFDRKNYFYPDLPKAYQISQLYLPLCRNGRVTINEGTDFEKQIQITEIHMEEDAGKLIHNPVTRSTQIDFNRCGVPLIEIVTAPDFRSAEEVSSYLDKLKTTLQYLGVSDCKMQEGSMRADINLSVRKSGQHTLGTRTELKNMNSIKAITRAIEFESQRQIHILEAGGKITQDTLRWDDDKGECHPMRTKENAQDYRYFPEPDLPEIYITQDKLYKLRSALPEFADNKKLRYMKDYLLSEYDSKMLTRRKDIALFFEETTTLCGKPKEVANWILGDLMRILSGEEPLENLSITPENLALLVKKVHNGSLNRATAKEIFEKNCKEPLDIEQHIKDNNLGQICDNDLIKIHILDTFSENPKTVQEYLSGKTKVFAFLVGQTMRKLKGKADPAIINEITKQELDNLLTSSNPNA